MFGGYFIPHQLMQTFYDAEFETVEDGLHGRITFKDAETRENVLAVMKAQKALDDALEKFNTDGWRGHYTNKEHIDHMRLVDEITNAIPTAMRMITHSLLSGKTLSINTTIAMKLANPLMVIMMALMNLLPMNINMLPRMNTIR